MLILLSFLISLSTLSFADSNVLIKRACELNPNLSICSSDEVEPDNAKLGSLLRLSESSNSKISQIKDESTDLIEKDLPVPIQGSNQSSVSVFLSEHCVQERERFVRKCHGTVDKEEISFCKSYPSSCSTVGDAIPIMTYCARYYKKYPSLCKIEEVDENVQQFCFAFEEFCLPDPDKPRNKTTTPEPVLKKCKDVAKEARKVCRPFPDESDQLNYTRCTQFLIKCRKYADWI